MDELTRQSITVKKIHLGIVHDATVGLIIETQSISHFRDTLEADARVALKLVTKFLSQFNKGDLP